MSSQDCNVCVNSGNGTTCDGCECKIRSNELIDKFVCVCCFKVVCSDCFDKSFVQQAIDENSAYNDGPDSYMCDVCYLSVFAPVDNYK